jgi:3-deoxy-D-manno-octulosonic-acid transferase
MLFLYDFVIYIYFLFVKIASLFNSKAAAFINGRKCFNQRIVEHSKYLKGQSVVWFHCASLGEYEQAKPLIAGIKNNLPLSKIVLTFFSPSGYQVVINQNHEVDIIEYLPKDTNSNAKLWLDAVHPNLVIFTKYDLWYHYLAELHSRSIPVFLIDAVFNDKQIFFKLAGVLHREMIQFFEAIFVQNDASKRHLATIYDKSIIVAGDTRYDTVLRIKDIPFNDIKITSFVNQFDYILVAGSTWDGDEELIAKLVSKLPTSWGIIVAPHEVHNKHIHQLNCTFPNAVLYSKIQANSSDSNVLLIDNIGMLSKLYRYASIAWIGGGFTKSGIHNCLEAAVYEVIIAFGPNYEKYIEAVDLINCNGAMVIEKSNDLLQLIRDVENNEIVVTLMRKACTGFIERNTGATNHIINYLKSNQYFK